MIVSGRRTTFHFTAISMGVAFASGAVLACCLTGCTPVQRRAFQPETIGVTIGGGLGFDRESARSGPRSFGVNVAVTPVFRLRPAPVAKVADTSAVP